MNKNQIFYQNKPNHKYSFVLKLGKELKKPNILRQSYGTAPKGKAKIKAQDSQLFFISQLSELLKLREYMLPVALQLNIYSTLLTSGQQNTEN